MNKNLYVTILAGGVGKRMGSTLPKVLHKVKGEAMVVRLIKQVLMLEPAKIMVVVGKFYQQIKEEIEKNVNDEKIVYVMQAEPLGTGHAVKCTLEHLGENVDNIILNGDVPMITARTVNEIYQKYLAETVGLMITSIELDNPAGNGRIIKDGSGDFGAIVEEKDCMEEERMVKLVNCGIYVAKGDVLVEYIPKIGSVNAQGEYYLTDLVKLYHGNGRIGLYELAKEKEVEVYNVNTKEQLAYIDGN